MVDIRDMTRTNIITPDKCYNKPDPMYFNTEPGKLTQGRTRKGKAECRLCTLYNICYWIDHVLNNYVEREG